jgi:hypothetical protein
MKKHSENRNVTVEHGAGLIMAGVIALTACGGLNATSDGAPSGKVDAAAIDSASAADGPAKTVCDPLAPFGPWVSLGAQVQSGLTGGLGRLSIDELDFYFSATTPGSTDYNLYVSQRSTRSASFGAPRPLTLLNSNDFDADPSISTDGLSLWFESNRAGAGFAVYVATRPNLMSEFGAPGLANGLNTTVNITNSIHPFITSDNSEIWFVSDRPGGMGLFDIWQAKKSSSTFLPPQVMAALNSSNEDWLPVLSADKLTLYLQSTRSGGPNYDVFRTQRSTVNDGFPAPVLVPELNVDNHHFVSWISSDNCRIYGRHQNIASVAMRQP